MHPRWFSFLTQLHNSISYLFMVTVLSHYSAVKAIIEKEIWDSIMQLVSAAAKQESHHHITVAVIIRTGDGHFSPVGGFHAAKDMVLILDTARFKYAPHWVPLADLFEAMSHLDSATGKARGFIMLTANPMAKSVMFTLERHNR